jgi:hypothetical protein
MEIQIKDKNFTLKYNNKALFKIEQETGIGVISLFQNPDELNKLSVLYIVIWAAIQEQISFDEFSDLADPSEIMEFLPKIVKEVGKAFETGSKKK